MRLRLFAALLICVLLAMHGAFAESEVPAEQDGSWIHVSRELTSPFLHLLIDADVQPVETGTRLPTYRTDCAQSTREAWLEVFFGDPQAEVIDRFEGKSTEWLLSHLIADADRERAYTSDERSTRYQAYSCSLVYDSTEKELYINMSGAKEGAQAEDLAMTPEQARGIAQGWIEQFSAKLGWEGFMWSDTYALSPSTGEYVEDLNNAILTGIYLVEYERFMNGIPVARDVIPYSDLYVDGDVMQLYIDDSGVLYIKGVCRSYEEQGSAVINVSLEDALAILEENMDYVGAFPEEGSDGFTIQEVGLCWRLIPELSGEDMDYNAVMTARPAWRFASGICRCQTDVFVMYIDAETGEILE